MEIAFEILKIIGGVCLLPFAFVAAVAVVVFAAIIVMIIGYFVFGLLPFSIYKFFTPKKK